MNEERVMNKNVRTERKNRNEVWRMVCGTSRMNEWVCQLFTRKSNWELLVLSQKMTTKIYLPVQIGKCNEEHCVYVRTVLHHRITCHLRRRRRRTKMNSFLSKYWHCFCHCAHWTQEEDLSEIIWNDMIYVLRFGAFMNTRGTERKKEKEKTKQSR